MKLSDQALMCVMVALQKSLMEQSDIVPVLKQFNLSLNDTNELVVDNPPDRIVAHKNEVQFDTDVEA